MPCTTNMMSRANRLILLLLVLVLLPLSGQATNPEDSLLLGLTSVTTQRLNPFTSVEREMMSLTALIYEGLVQIDDDYNPRPCLAERWESSSDGRTWYFTLREGLTFPRWFAADRQRCGSQRT
jgi:ABC-type transport system substrate-binding protein